MKTLYILLTTCLLLAACQNEDLKQDAIGYLRLEVGTDKTTQTRAEDEYNPKQIAVKIVNSAGKTVEETDDWTTLAKAIELPVGKYTIEASSAGFDGKTAGWDKPYYAAKETVDIKANTNTSKEIICKLANVLVTVEFSDEFRAAFRSAVVGVSDKSNSDNKVTFEMRQTSETGKAYFPVTDLIANLTVSNYESDIHSKKDTITGIKAQENVILRYRIASSGSSNIGVTVDDATKTYTYTIGVPVTATNTLIASANAWSTFAYLTAEIPSFADIFDQSKLEFQYKTADAAEWSKVTTNINVEEKDKKFSTKLTGLTPATAYQYRLYYNDGSEEGITSETVNFTTETPAELYNGNFDNWWRKEEKDSSPWYAISGNDATSFDNSKDKYLFSFWDSGNGGTVMMSKNPTSPESTEVHKQGGKSAKLASQYVGVAMLGLGKFAAGNIYTGHFCYANTSTYQARINFGQPFTSRPTQLKGWFKYNRGTKIDYSTGNYKTLLEQTGGDLCSVYIALTDNPGFTYDGKEFAYQIDGDLSGDNPAEFKYKSTIDFSESNPHIIAYGTITDEEAKGTGAWQEFTIDLKYRDLNRTPKFIIIVASASKYGDFFTGSTSSVMYVDDFELIYGDTPVMSE